MRIYEAIEWFRLENVSKAAAKFDLDKLRFINREHMKMMDPKELSRAFGFADADIGELAKCYLEEGSTVKEIKPKSKRSFRPKTSAASGPLIRQFRRAQKLPDTKDIP